MKGVFRENPLLALSVVLPVAVVLLFAAATAIPRWLTDPPAHDLLLSVEHVASPRVLPVRIQLSVENASVVARAVKLGEYEQGYAPRIFRYNHESGSVREITIPIPDDIETMPNGKVIPIPELEGVAVSPELVAPDGYEYRGYHGRNGFILEFFGTSRGRQKITVAKNGAIVAIDLPDAGYWYYGTRFLGWVNSE
ncbi:MAG: hypothetical protein R3212_13335, partial [Xanthomonadales bacterium]|nr:hypothetical protein [Xanthomonadales bacterium]